MSRTPEGNARGGGLNATGHGAAVPNCQYWGVITQCS